MNWPDEIVEKAQQAYFASMGPGPFHTDDEPERILHNAMRAALDAISDDVVPKSELREEKRLPLGVGDHIEPLGHRFVTDWERVPE